MTSIELQLGFQKMWDTEFSGWKEMPTSAEDAAKKWADLFYNYYKSMGIPVPGISNLNLTTGIKAFESSFLAMIKSNNVINQLEIIITTLHFNIVAGSNLYGWVGVPPSSKLNLKQCFLKGNYEGKAITVCQALAKTIDIWVHTTYSVHSVSGAVAMWN